MKVNLLEIGWYKFSPSNKRVYIFGLNDSLGLDNVLLIVNITTNTVIYQFNKPSLSAIIADNVLTLTYDTTSMSATDDLIIYLEVPIDNVDLPINKEQLKLDELCGEMQKAVNELKKINIYLSLIKDIEIEDSEV